MSYHKLLDKQITKHLPESLINDPEFKKFLFVVNQSYIALERDTQLAERAFNISEQEYAALNQQLMKEAEVKKLSIEKLKEAVGTITGEELQNESDDLLVIARYLNQQISKRKNAEKVFTSLISNLQNAILLESETRHISYVNQRFCDMFNIPLSPEALQGADCTSSAEDTKQLFKDPEKFVADIDKLLENKILVTGEILELTDGRTFERDYIPIYIDNKYQGHLWSYSDITEKKKAQDAIVKSEQTNRQILNAALDAIVIINHKSEIEFWNPNAEKIFGWTETEIKGKKISETIIPATFRTAHEKGMAHFHQTGEGPVLNKIIELTAINKNHEQFPIEISIIPVKQDNKISFCAFIRDISARKKAEKELKSSQELWQFALEGAGDGVTEYDFETNEIFLSHQYKKMMGYDENEFNNKADLWIKTLHPDDRHIVEDSDQLYLENKISSHQLEYRIKDKQGNYRWILERGKVIQYSQSGKPKRIIGTHTDITGRKLAEEEYKRMSLVASANENGVLFTDPEGHIFWNNEGFSKMTGFSAEEIKGKTPLELCEGPLTKGDERKSMLKSFFEGRSFNVQIVFYRKDQSIFWGKVTGQAIMDEGNKVKIYFAIIEDITDKINVEQKLEDQRIFYEQILDNIPSDIAVFDSEHRYLYVNPKGIKDPELRKWLIGKKDEDYLTFRNKPLSLLTDRRNVFNSVLKSKKLKSWEEELKLPNNTNQYIMRNMFPVLDEKREIKLVIGYGIDITNIKNIQKEVELSEKKYRDVIDNSLAIITTHDMEGKLISVNPMVEKIYGYTDEETIGHNLLEFMPEDDRPLFDEFYLSAIKKEKRASGILRTVHKQGHIVYTLYNNFLKEDEGAEPYVIGFAVDITDRIKAEKELKIAKRITEDLAQTKQNFLANMSHEIRTPMNAIMGMANQLGKSKLDEGQRFYLNIINSATENLLVIINDILDLSKIEAGKLSLEIIGFEPTVLIERVMQVMLHKAQEKGLQLTNSYSDSRLNPVLVGDPYRLNQVLLNLLSNAIKFTEKGSVDISCSVVEDTETTQKVQVRVNDTGIGMDESYVKNLFMKFTQEDESVTRRFGGTGLGMSICKELVELMGGTIEASSKKGVGTTISFTIDFQKGTIDQLPVKETGSVNTDIFAGKRILITDDNEMNRLVASTILKNYGATTDEAQNGNEAIQKLKNVTFDIVLMDIQMPVMDGVEATNYIRKHISKTLPVIALTAFAIKGDDHKFIDAGMNDYLSKPFEENQFLKVIARWLGTSVTFIAKETAPVEQTELYNLSKLQLIAKGDQGFVNKMINLFIDNAINSVKEINAAYEAGNFETIKKIAHRIKPSIDMVGIESLKKEIRQIEKQAVEEPQTEEFKQLLQKLDEVLLKVVEELKKLVAE